MPGIKVLESLKVWEDIYRALHPFGQPDGECRERAEYVEAVRLHKEEYSMKVFKVHMRELLCGSCCDCSRKWFKGADKVKAVAQVERLKAFQGWHSLKCLIFSRSWK